MKHDKRTEKIALPPPLEACLNEKNESSPMFCSRACLSVRMGWRTRLLKNQQAQLDPRGAEAAAARPGRRRVLVEAEE